MAITEDKLQRFMQAQTKAKKLIQMDMEGGFDKYQSKATQMASSMLTESVPEPQQYQPYQETVPTKTNSKLPKEILESFKNKQIDTTALSVATSPSILDEVNYKTQGQLFNTEVKQKQQPIVNNIAENIAPTSNVDYSMIKMIVEECVRKYTSSLKKSILNESKTNDDCLKAMKIGDKFSFITKNGDLYEAELKFVKNINKKG